MAALLFVDLLCEPDAPSRRGRLVRLLFTRSGELIRSHPVILGLVVVWTFAPLVALLVYIGQHGGVWTGANGWDPLDQFQYLAWVRDEGRHLLGSNLWVIGHTPHDYLQPMFAISGLLWRLGVSVQLAYLVWKPTAVLVLFLGCAAYVRHLLVESHWQRAAALLLTLFYASPVFALANWTGHLSEGHRLALRLVTNDADSALNLWSFEHTAIAIGLMPVFLIATERLLSSPATRRARRHWTALASLAGLLVSWLHPWQGLTLLGIIGGLFVFRPPRRRYLAVATPVVATLLPLIYGLLLSRADPSWRLFQQQSLVFGTAPWWALLAAVGPLVAFAVLGVRRSAEDREWMLVLWVFVGAGVYFLVPEYPPHALNGLSLPLAVLAVRGWQRARLREHLPRRLAALVAVAAVLAVTVPAAVYDAQLVRRDFSNDLAGDLNRQLLVLNPSQAAAVAYIDRSPRRGGVLAPWLLSMSVPAFTGREVYAGHANWQPPSHLAITDSFFNPALKDPGGALRQSLLKQAKATFIIADCGSPPTLATEIAPVARLVKRFGCVNVYETLPPGRER